MKRIMVLVCLLALACSVCLAQSDDPGCSVVVSVTDADCGTGNNCGSATGCTSSAQFHLLCQGTGWFKAWVECGDTECANCVACVQIVTAGTGDIIATCGTFGVCGEDSCCAACSHPFPIGDYIMRVCLLPCPQGNERECCSGECKAYATFSTNPLSCAP